jgi:hypothetical protein
VKRSAITAVLVVSLVAMSHTTAAGGQGWSAEVSAGRLVYDPLLASVATNNLMGSVRYDTRRGTWVYGTGAVPASDGGTFWGAAGTGGRVTLPSFQIRRATLGADLGVHAFSFRDRLVNQSGSGGTLEAMPFARVNAGAGFVEGRGGWRGHTVSFAGLRENRGVFETGARAGYGSGVRVEGEARLVHADEGRYPFIGGFAAYDISQVTIWGQLGKWMATSLDDRTWALGSGVSLGPRTTLWGNVRQEAPDPLYWNPSHRTWSIGLTQRLGRPPAAVVPVPVSMAGNVVVRLAASEAPTGAVAIAGDFNNWKPTPMRREGNEWIVRLPLAPGVYHYTFRSATGDWFVPSSTAGRRDDGMGGFVAVLVVS